MTKKVKPAAGATGVRRETFNFLHNSTIPRKIQLFGTFDHDTKSAVILLAGEVCHGE